MKSILSISTLIFYVALISAQENVPLLLRAKVEGDLVHLRWAPTKSNLWLEGNHKGYVILRSSLSDQEGKYQVLDSIFPATLEQFRAFAQHDNRMMLNLGATALHRSDTQHTSITINQELESRYTSALYAADCDALTAHLMALRYTDSIASPGEKYQYIVMLAGNQIDQNQNAVIVDLQQKSIPAPIVVTRVVEDERKINLAWMTHPRYPAYTAYYVERSINGIEFEQVNRAPFTFTPDIDSLVPDQWVHFRDSVDNYQLHYYRIRGIDLFGDLGPYSETIKAMGRDRIPPAKATDLTFEWKGDLFQLFWDHSEQDDIVGFNIRSTDHLDNPATVENAVLLGPEQRNYTGYLEEWFRGRLFYVCAVDTAGNESFSDPIMIFKHNAEAPARVEQIRGEIDSSGRMTLSWAANKEEDLWGYMIYMANDSLHDFSGIVGTPLRDTFFVDTLPMKTLSEQVYYKIVASDFAGNLSPVSPIITLSRPDLIPPNAPNFNYYQVTEDGVYLKWGPSLSADVLNHQLYRRKKGDVEWSAIAQYATLVIDHLDTLVDQDIVYQYRILAEDDAGLQANCPKDITVRTRKLKNDFRITDLQIDSDDDQHVIKWSYPVTDEVRYIIYVSKNNGPYSTYTITRNNFLSKMPAGNGVYSFKIRAQHTDGKKSKISDPIQIET